MCQPVLSSALSLERAPALDIPDGNSPLNIERAESRSRDRPSSGTTTEQGGRRSQDRRARANLYLIAVAFSILAVIARLILQPAMGDRVPYATFFAALMVIAWYGGLFPTLFATVLLALAADFLFLPPFHTLIVTSPADRLGLALFVAVGFSIALIGEGQQRQRRKAEQAMSDLQDRESMLAGQRQRLDDLLSAIPGVVWETWIQPDAAEQHENFVSAYVRTMLGYTPREWISDPDFWLGIVHPDDRDEVAKIAAEAFASGSPFTATFRWLTKDRRTLWAEASAVTVRDAEGRPIGIRGVTMDISTRKSLEEQLLQSQKMESVGQLAGGIAHEFNNLLTVILGFNELAQVRVAPDDAAQEDLKQVERAARRAAELTNQLLAYARKQIVTTRVVDLAAFVSDMTRIVIQILGENIELIAPPADGCVNVRADPNQLAQVLLNLAVNARDAMPDGGTLTIETLAQNLDAEYVRPLSEAGRGPYACLRITDTGVGMDEEVLSHLFEPFFSTKGVGKGTGLGLATCYGIVKQNGGHITVSSKPGAGASFSIYLPLVAEKADDAPAPERRSSPRGSETLLVVEDEAVVRAMTVRTLQKQGYTVIEARDGLEALALAHGRERRIDLLLTDVMMPRMDGRELAERLRAQAPDLKVILVSGYADALDGAGERDYEVVRKPFTPTLISERVRQALDAVEN
jgi:PAS domain S-box-containing protein